MNCEEENEDTNKFPNIDNKNNKIINQNKNSITCCNWKITSIIHIEREIFRNTCNLPKIKNENILKTEKNVSINIYPKTPLSEKKTNYATISKSIKQYNNLQTYSNNFGLDLRKNNSNSLMINNPFNKSYSAKKSKIISNKEKEFKINEREKSNDKQKESINKLLSKNILKKFNLNEKSSVFKSNLKISMAINNKRSNQNNIFKKTQKSNNNSKIDIYNNNNSPNKKKEKNKVNNNNKTKYNFKLKHMILPKINNNQKILEDYKKEMEKRNHRIEERKEKKEKEAREKAEARKRHEKEVYNKSIKLKYEETELRRGIYELKHGK